MSIRLREGAYGGTPCSEFDFYGDVDAHEITFTNARVEDALGDDTAWARGGYNVLVQTTTFDEDAFHAVGEGQPFYRSAVATLTYDVAVSADQTDFRSTRTVVPYRQDPGGILRQHPRVERFDVANNSAAVGDPTYEVDWTASDPDGDLERVELYLVHQDDGRVVDSEAYGNVSGPVASGTETLTDGRLGADSSDEYLLVVGVVDGDGRATMESEPR